jgi:predicted CopG family antitoxin
MMSTIKVDMEVKAGLQLFKKVERESFNDAIKRVIYLALENNECFVNEQEKKAIMNAVRSVEEGRTQSFKQMMKNIQKTRGGVKK